MSADSRLTVKGLINLLMYKLDYDLDQDDASLEILDPDEGSILFLAEEDVDIELVGAGQWKIIIRPSYDRRVS